MQRFDRNSLLAKYDIPAFPQTTLENLRNYEKRKMKKRWVSQVRQMKIVAGDQLFYVNTENTNEPFAILCHKLIWNHLQHVHILNMDATFGLIEHFNRKHQLLTISFKKHFKDSKGELCSIACPLFYVVMYSKKRVMYEKILRVIKNHAREVMGEDWILSYVMLDFEKGFHRGEQSFINHFFVRIRII